MTAVCDDTFYTLKMHHKLGLLVFLGFLVGFNQIGYCWRELNLSVFNHIPSSCACLLRNIPAVAKFGAQKFAFVINLFCAIKGEKMQKNKNIVEEELCLRLFVEDADPGILDL